MQRRDFLKKTALTSVALAWPFGLPLYGGDSAARRVVVQLTLDGGPDFRHLFMPPIDGTFGEEFWPAHATAHGVWWGHSNDRKLAESQTIWGADYEPITYGGHTFGLLKNANWLKEQIEANRVAIVHNVVGSSSRDHVHSLLALDYGRHDAAANDMGGSGWGGRLARECGGNLVSITRTPRAFCYGPLEADRFRRTPVENFMTILDARNATLFDHRLQPGWRDTYSRALSSYYAAAHQQGSSAHLGKLLEHEKSLRQLSHDIAAALPEPDALPQAIRELNLHNGDFARQIRTLHECAAYAPDVLDLRVASLGYGGWDTHKHQDGAMKRGFGDLFGKATPEERGGGLQALFDSLGSSAIEVTLVISGEFGRQIRSNGDYGTDHGRGNTVLVIGPSVRGGIYGDPFPSSEIEKLVSGARSPDIDGRTHIEHLLKKVADWGNGADTGDRVIGDLAEMELESGVSFDALFI